MLRLPKHPITEELYRQMPEGPPYYELIMGNLLLRDEPETLCLPFDPITTEFYEKMPEGPPYYQLILGNLIMSPSPNFYHQKIVVRLCHYLESYVEDHGLGEVVIAPSDVFIDGVNVFQPDLYYVSNERRHLIDEKGFQGAPDLVVEILSPSTSIRDRNEKRKVYVAAGVKEMWIINPETREIEFYPSRLGLDAVPRLIREPEFFSSTFFPGLTIETSRLFKPVV